MNLTEQRTAFPMSFHRIQVCAIILFGIYTLSACTTTGKKEATGVSKPVKEHVEAGKMKKKKKPEAPPSEPPVVAPVQEKPLPEKKAGESGPSKDDPSFVVEYCRGKPYQKYQREVMQMMDEAWKRTREGAFAVGFRNEAEFDKWDSTQQSFFSGVYSSCKVLALCISRDKNPGACKAEEDHFTEWQTTAKAFLAKVKILKQSQPPPLCGFKPTVDDPRYCFEQLANRIDNKCKEQNCVETSQCWRSVSILDQIVKQAESSCKFAGEALDKCSGYQSASNRKNSRIKECAALQNDLNISILPVL